MMDVPSRDSKFKISLVLFSLSCVSLCLYASRACVHAVVRFGLVTRGSCLQWTAPCCRPDGVGRPWLARSCGGCEAFERRRTARGPPGVAVEYGIRDREGGLAVWDEVSMFVADCTGIV